MWLPRLGPAPPDRGARTDRGRRAGRRLSVPVGGARWIPGEGAALDTIDDPVTFALDLAELVLEAPARADRGAPPARSRARPLRDYDEATRRAIDAPAT